MNPWASEGWHLFVPKGNTVQSGKWFYVAQVDTGYFRAYANGGYYDIEEIGEGTWSNRAESPTFPNETIVISAIRRESDWKVWRGHRHHNCIHTIFKETGKPVGSGYVQGFETNTGRFVDRLEGFKIAKAADQVVRPNLGNPDAKPGTYYDGPELFSEDLY